MGTEYDHNQVLKSAAHLQGISPDTLTKIVSDANDEVFFLDKINPGFNGDFDYMESYFKFNLLANPTLPGEFCGTAADDATVGAVAWTNVTDAQDDTPTTSADCATGTSHYLKCTNFGFDLPANATIVGIKVTATINSDTGAIDNSVKIVKGGTISGDEKADAIQWPDSKGTKSWGNAADLWGLSWTVADIESSGFGVAISKQGAVAVEIFTVEIEVYYTIDVTYKWQIYTRGDSAWRDLFTGSNTWITGEDTGIYIIDEGFTLAADISPGVANTPYMIRLTLSSANSGEVTYTTSITDSNCYQRIFGEAV